MIWASLRKHAVDNGASAGPTGWTGAMVWQLFHDDVCLDGVVALLNAIVSGTINGAARDILLSSRLIALQKFTVAANGVKVPCGVPSYCCW